MPVEEDRMMTEQLHGTLQDPLSIFEEHLDVPTTSSEYEGLYMKSFLPKGTKSTFVSSEKKVFVYQISPMEKRY